MMRIQELGTGVSRTDFEWENMSDYRG